MEIDLRKANMSDAEFLFELRNDPEAFKYYRNPKKIEWEGHVEWLKNVIEGKTNKELYVIEAEGERAGQIRFDHGNEGAEIGISLSKYFRGKGLGSLSLEKGIGFMKGKVKYLTAEIHKDNLASMKLFERFGFQFKEQKDNFKEYEKRI